MAGSNLLDAQEALRLADSDPRRAVALGVRRIELGKPPTEERVPGRAGKDSPAGGQGEALRFTGCFTTSNRPRLRTARMP